MSARDLSSTDMTALASAAWAMATANHPSGPYFDRLGKELLLRDVRTASAEDLSNICWARFFVLEIPRPNLNSNPLYFVISGLCYPPCRQ